MTPLRPALPGSHLWPAGADPEPPAPGWRELMERCWAHNPADRPAMREVMRQLHGMLEAAAAARWGDLRLSGCMERIRDRRAHLGPECN